MKSRRRFIKHASLGAIGFGLFPNQLLAHKDMPKITILHTNDMHSHIHPLTKGKNKGFGGMAERATIVNKIRRENDNVLLLDAGDIFQGTPYYNFYGGELEFKLMSKLKYDAATLGNHDFDNGLDGLKKQLPFADFPFLCSNYNFTDTTLNGYFKPYKVFQKGEIKIGVFGIGIKLEGLVPKQLYKETKYEDPIAASNLYAKILKKEYKCDLVICLSHLGYYYSNNKVSDTLLAKNTNNIDLIIGGHTHTFLNQPIEISNLNNDKVLIAQAGWAGINIGRIDFIFKRKMMIKNIFGRSIFVKKNKKLI